MSRRGTTQQYSFMDEYGAKPSGHIVIRASWARIVDPGAADVDWRRFLRAFPHLQPH